MRITKRFRFSASHRYYVSGWTEDKNREVFGKCIHIHGHNYTLDVTVEGAVDPVTGMVMNLSDLKNGVLRVLEDFDHRYLNEEVPEFREKLPTTENLAIVLWNRIASILPSNVHLAKIRLEETEDLYVEYDGPEQDSGNPEPTLVRRYRFSAAHRLHSPQLDENANQALYGKCNNPYGHGHDYTVIVGVKGPLNALGMVLSLQEMDLNVKQVLDPLDHRWLDKEIPFFSKIPATTENLLTYLCHKLRGKLRNLAILKIEETPSNFFELGGDQECPPIPNS